MELPLIHTAHTLYEEYRHYLFLGRLLPASAVRRYLQLFLSGYKILVCPSIKAQTYFKNVAPRIRNVVIGNGVCRTRFQPRSATGEERAQLRSRLGLRSSDKVVLYAGRLAREKRVLELLDVLIPLLRKHPDYKALFVGSGADCGPMIHVVKANRIQEQVKLVGYVDWERMHQLYSVADLFTTASLSEVHPMTLIEASMCGLGIVARRDDSLVDLVKDGYNGYLVDSDPQIAERVSEILGDESKLLWFSKNGLELSYRFDAEAHVDKFESLYEEMMETEDIPV
jgi:1,2-diacylglycerol 3-alpha-glucosyltransferase